MNKIQAVIFDWAGTTVDFGCFAPVGAFQRAFEGMGLFPTLEETRAPMGLPKRDHVARMLQGQRLGEAFRKLHGREPGDRDIDTIYSHFEPALFETLEQYVDILPGVLDTTHRLKQRGIPMGSTTGYTRAMMDVVAPLAEQNGYRPDCIVCPDEVGGAGRPYPYMLWKNLQALGVQDVRRVIKVGDTLADIREGKNAGCITIGVLAGSSMVGLSLEETRAMAPEALSHRMQAAADAYLKAGADAVIESIEDLPQWIGQTEEAAYETV